MLKVYKFLHVTSISHLPPVFKESVLKSLAVKRIIYLFIWFAGGGPSVCVYVLLNTFDKGTLV